MRSPMRNRNQQRQQPPTDHHLSAATAMLLCATVVAWVVAGCRAGGQMAIPAGADEVASGDDRLVYEAPSAGKAYVLDKEDNKVRWSGDVRTGDKIVVRPNDNRIEVDGRVASESDLDEGHNHSIYFDER